MGEYRMVVTLDVRGEGVEYEFTGTKEEIKIRELLLADKIIKSRVEDLRKVTQIRGAGYAETGV